MVVSSGSIASATQRRMFPLFIGCISTGMLNVVKCSYCVLTSAFFITQKVNSSTVTTLGLILPTFDLLGKAKLVVNVNTTTQCSLSSNETSDRVRHAVFARTLRLTFVTVLFFFVVKLFFTEPLYILLKTSKAALPRTVPCVHVLLVFSPLFLYGGLLGYFIEGSKRPQLSVATVLIKDLAGVILSCVFVCPVRLNVAKTTLTATATPLIKVDVLSVRF